VSVLDLARAEIRALSPYVPAPLPQDRDAVLLNANESAWPPPGDDGLDCHRYPSPQPAALLAVLSELYGVDRRHVLITRGSDEAIDLLVRVFCRAGKDAIAIQPPTFGMYAMSARIQGAGIVTAPLRADFTLDVDAVLGAMTDAVKIVFVCAPNNPSGQAVDVADIGRLAMALRTHALLVIDEAYVEFADAPSATSLLASHEHVVVLRTLSKAWALAGARLGCVLAQPPVVALLRKVLPPYPLPRPCVELALRALSPAGREQTGARIALVCSERDRMRQALAALPAVRAVVPSQTNFLTVRFADIEDARRRLHGSRIMVRDFADDDSLCDALRITIGMPAENDRVLAALAPARGCQVADIAGRQP
jgi:histidinol-phosphate aminotransferase